MLKDGSGNTVWTRDNVSPTASTFDLASTASGKGASLVGFIQSGLGAQGQAVQNKLKRPLDLLDFVAPSDYASAVAGTFDLSPALGAAIDEALTRGADTVRLPAGTLLLNSKITKSLTGFQGLAIEGKGMGLTQLICADPTGYGLEFNCTAQNWWIDVSPSNPFRFANFSICSTVLNLGTGLKINGGSLEGRVRPACVFDHVEFRAKDSINNQAFLTALWLNDCGGTYFDGCRWLNGGTSNITPTSVKISATDATTDPTSYLFDNCEWYYGGKGIVCGDNPEGIHLANCVMVKVDRGVEWICAAESGLTVVGGHFNCLSYNFYLDGVFDVTITGVLSFLSGASPQDHVYFANANNATITGNVLYAGTNGLNVGTLPAGSRGSYIGNNQFSAMTTGINLSGAANNVTVGPNGFTSVTNRVAGAGGAGSFIQKRSWSTSAIPTLVGGATSEAINISVPTNTFLAKPTVVVATAEGSSADYICSYNSSTSTATSIQLRIVRRDGGTISAGAARFNVVAYE